MKNLGPWIKANLVWLIAVGVAVIALPVALFFSLSWNASIKKSVGDDVSAAVGKLQNLRVDYALPAVTPGQPAWSLPKTEPNTPTTEAVVAELKRLSAESDAVREAAEQRNKAGKALLVEGLFPKPADESARVRLLTELAAERPKWAQRVLEEVGAGGPPDAERLVTMLQTRRDEEERRKTGSRVDQKLSPDEQAEISQRLTEARMEFLQRGAASVRFFALAAALDAERPGEGGPGRGGAGGPGGGPGGPGGQGERAPQLATLEQAWQWQSNAWVQQDVVAALAKANTGAGGQRLSALDGPVKRLLRLTILEEETAVPAPSAAGAEGGEAGGGGGAASGDERTPITKDFNRNHTGRPKHSGLYDVVEVEIDIVCDSARVNAVLAAIAATNFMSVTDVDIKPHDPRPDLAEGYSYGNDHVVRATIRADTVWLRSWIKPFMPMEVWKKLGIPDDPPPAEGSPEGGAEGGAPSGETPAS